MASSVFLYHTSTSLRNVPLRLDAALFCQKFTIHLVVIYLDTLIKSFPGELTSFVDSLFYSQVPLKTSQTPKILITTSPLYHIIISHPPQPLLINLSFYVPSPLIEASVYTCIRLLDFNGMVLVYHLSYQSYIQSGLYPCHPRRQSHLPQHCKPLSTTRSWDVIRKTSLRRKSQRRKLDRLLIRRRQPNLITQTHIHPMAR